MRGDAIATRSPVARPSGRSAPVFVQPARGLREALLAIAVAGILALSLVQSVAPPLAGAAHLPTRVESLQPPTAESPSERAPVVHLVGSEPEAAALLPL